MRTLSLFPRLRMAKIERKVGGPRRVMSQSGGSRILEPPLCTLMQCIAGTATLHLDGVDVIRVQSGGSKSGTATLHPDSRVMWSHDPPHKSVSFRVMSQSGGSTILEPPFCTLTLE